MHKKPDIAVSEGALKNVRLTPQDRATCAVLLRQTSNASGCYKLRDGVLYVLADEKGRRR